MSLQEPTTSEILAALRDNYTSKHFETHIAFFEELRIGTGYGKDNEQRIDAFTINLYPSERLARTAFEVKVSRSDFKKELRQPTKRRVALMYSNRFYFVAPKGLIARDELPLEAGLIEYHDGRCDTVVQAPWRDSYPPSWNFVASLARRIQRLEREAAKELKP